MVTVPGVRKMNIYEPKLWLSVIDMSYQKEDGVC